MVSNSRIVIGNPKHFHAKHQQFSAQNMLKLRFLDQLGLKTAIRIIDEAGSEKKAKRM